MIPLPPPMDPPMENRFMNASHVIRPHLHAALDWLCRPVEEPPNSCSEAEAIPQINTSKF